MSDAAYDRWAAALRRSTGSQRPRLGRDHTGRCPRPHRYVDRRRNDRAIVAEQLLGEVNDVLGRPKLRHYIDADSAAAFVAELSRLAEWHGDPVNPPRVCRDRDDDYLLALAIRSDADALVTGDQDLHDIEHAGVDIITPRELLERSRAQQR